MSESCNHDCSSCKENCASRDKKSFIEKQNEKSNIKKVVGVVSGKGGVGKSLITSLLAIKTRQKGFNTAILDADITGPSIPKVFGLKDKAKSVDGQFLYPVLSKTGIKIMSMNLLLDKDEEPVVWRGPVIAGAVKQFWTDVAWDEVDYMFVDMPPGTGDVPLTVFQSIPLNGIIVVTSPQDLVSMIVAKAVKMAEMMEIPIYGLVENYSYLECPNCKEKISIFGESKVCAVANDFNIDTVTQIPLDKEIAKNCDLGNLESLNFDFLDNLIDKIVKK